MDTGMANIEILDPRSNLTFGGRNRSRIFICGSQTLFAQYVNRRGAERP